LAPDSSIVNTTGSTDAPHTLLHASLGPAIKGFDTVGLDISLSVVTIACLLLIWALYHRLSLPALAYFPSVCGSFVVTLGVRLAADLDVAYYHTKVALVIVAQMCASIGVVMCAVAWIVHFLCFYRRADPGPVEEDPLQLCSHTWIDFVMLPLGTVCFVFNVLVLIGCVDLRTRLYVSPAARAAVVARLQGTSGRIW
jgi:hypothetical protein